MKPFFLLLLLLASGILFATLTRPFSLLLRTAPSPARVPRQPRTKRQSAFAKPTMSGRAGKDRKPALSRDRWRPAAQF